MEWDKYRHRIAYYSYGISGTRNLSSPICCSCMSSNYRKIVDFRVIPYYLHLTTHSQYYCLGDLLAINGSTTPFLFDSHTVKMKFREMECSHPSHAETLRATEQEDALREVDDECDSLFWFYSADSMGSCETFPADPSTETRHLQQPQMVKVNMNDLPLFSTNHRDGERLSCKECMNQLRKVSEKLVTIQNPEKLNAIFDERISFERCNICKVVINNMYELLHHLCSSIHRLSAHHVIRITSEDVEYYMQIVSCQGDSNVDELDINRTECLSQRTSGTVYDSHETEDSSATYNDSKNLKNNGIVCESFRNILNEGPVSTTNCNGIPEPVKEATSSESSDCRPDFEENYQPGSAGGEDPVPGPSTALAVAPLRENVPLVFFTVPMPSVPKKWLQFTHIKLEWAILEEISLSIDKLVPRSLQLKKGDRVEKYCVQVCPTCNHQSTGSWDYILHFFTYNHIDAYLQRFTSIYLVDIIFWLHIIQKRWRKLCRTFRLVDMFGQNATLNPYVYAICRLSAVNEKCWGDFCVRAFPGILALLSPALNPQTQAK